MRISRGNAFTLIEMLIVIGIVIMLAAILFPVFARARESGYQASALSQCRQVGIALQLYADGSDGKFLPSTNYGVASTDPSRLWTVGLLPYAKSKAVFSAPGTQGVFAEKWSDRSRATIGYSSATALDPANGCKDGQANTDLCLAFTTSASLDKQDRPAEIALLATTPGGALERGYLGYEFSPYNGTPHPADLRLSPPLVSDRDLVQEMVGISPNMLKPIYARYGSTGYGDGLTPVVFADYHAKSYSAKAINGMSSAIVWRFR